MIESYGLLRSYYTSMVVKKVIRSGGFRASFEHEGHDDTIPLPATLIHELSERMEATEGGSHLRLYSAFPFPNRAKRNLDAFQQNALRALQQSPDQPYVETFEADENAVVRVALADRLTDPSCVNCHNNHPETPKSDWEVGDVRGVLEVSMPIGDSLAAAATLEKITIALAGTAILVALAFSIPILRRLGYRLEKTIAALERVAGGDLDVQIEVERKDELGRIGESLNTTIRGMHDMVAVLHRAGSMMESAPVGLLRADLKGTIRYVNREGRHLLREHGISQASSLQDPVGAPLRDLLGDLCSDDLFSEHEPIRTTLQVGSEALDLRIHPLHDNTGRHIGPLVMWEVITRRLQAERELTSSLERERSTARREQELSQARSEDASRERSEKEGLEIDASLLLQTMSSAADGDLTRSVLVKGAGPMRRIATALERFLSDLRGEVEQIDHVSQSVLNEAGQLESLGERLLGDAWQASDRAAAVHRACDQVTSNVNGTAEISNGVAQRGHEIHSNVEEASRIASRAVQAAGSATDQIAKLDQSGRAIQEIVEIIDGLAQNSSLLALNASIQAAHAGSRGLAFAVVADEMKDLAVETARATEAVSSHITAIQRDTTGAIESIEQVGRVISEIDHNQEKVSDAVSSQVSATEEITNRMRDAAMALRTISDSTENVAQSSVNAAKTAEETETAASHLTESAERMRKVTGRFKY
jgi:methyl-accepting chemotaxis protein